MIWRYFAWSNQTLAVFTLWALTVYLVISKKPYIVTLIPALFIAFTLRHIKQKPEINYLNVTPTQPIPTAPTNAFSDLATDNAPRAK